MNCCHPKLECCSILDSTLLPQDRNSIYSFRFVLLSILIEPNVTLIEVYVAAWVLNTLMQPCLIEILEF